MRYLRLQIMVFIAIFLFLFLFQPGHLNSEYIIKWEKWEMNTHTGQVFDMVVGAGRNDSVTYIYTIEYNLSGYYEINEYDLVSGYKSRLGTFSAWHPVNIAIGDGSGFGKNLIYYKNNAGEIYSYEYQNNTWVKSSMITYNKDSVELKHGLSVGSLGGAYHIFTFDSDEDLSNIYWAVIGWTSEEIPYNGFWGSFIPGALTLGNGDSSVSGNEVYAAASSSSPIKQLYEIYYSWPSWVSEVIDSPISTDIIVAGDIDSWSGREIYVNNNTYDEITEYRKSSGQWVNFDSFGNSVRSMDVGLTRDAQSGNLRGCLYAVKKNGHLVLYQTVSMGWEEVVIDSNEDYKFVRSGENNFGAYAIHNGGNDKIAVWTPIRCSTPGIPNLKLPLDYTQDMGLTPTLQWYDNGSSSYKLNVYTGQSCSGTPIYSVEISGTSRQIPSGKLQNGTWYSWTVTGVNSCGPGNPSDCWCFKTACSYYVNVNSIDFDHNGGSYSFNVTTQSTCSWTAVPSDSWIHIISGSGTGNGTVSFSVDPNNSINPRSGNISVEGEIVTINQDGKPCTYSLDPVSNLFNSSGGAGSFSVNTLSGCTWTASENYSWITITSGGSGTGTGTVSYTVDPNTGIDSRTGYIYAGGQTHTVTQSGITCTYSLSPANDSFSSSGGTGSFNVNTPAGCSWTASENYSWINITSGSGGTGTGTVSYTVDPNSSTGSRTGYIYAGGQTFTVNQSGVSCSYSLNPANESFSHIGGTGSFNVSTTSGCSWTAGENYSWITITSGSSGTGSGTVYYSVDLNAGINSRTGYINAGGQTFTINQAGIACGYSLNPTGDSFGSAGGTGSFTVNTASDCNWTASENEDWLTITSGGSGPGTGTVSYAVDPNNSTDSRTGYIYAGGQTFTVNQDGLDPGAKILVIDLDGNNTSAPLIQTAIAANGYNTQYTTAVPQEIDPASYPVTFVCLGIFPSNHVLIAAEGDILKTYLDNGGKLYIEGNDTWAYDASTVVHPYFGIKPVYDGSGDTADVAGIAGTFTEGLNFTYGGENQYMDRIDVADGVTDAFIIWDNQSPYYHNGVARDTGTYKTIGVSFEFDGIPSEQHNNIMGKYLNFFMTDEPSINVTAPNGGETWGLGTPELITWTPFNITGNVKIVLFKNGSMVSTIAFDIPAAQGTYSWTVGNLADGTTASPGTGYVIRVKSMENSTYYDDSNGSFAISGLVLTSPNGGENWPPGTSKPVTWASHGIPGNVKLVLFKNGTLLGTIAFNIPITQGSYSWDVGKLADGTTVSPGTGYMIRVKSIDNKTYYDDSDQSFTISSDSCLTLAAPNGGETWDNGTPHLITWTPSGVTGNVKLILFKNGTRMGNIAYDIPAAQGSYSWTVGNLADGTTVLPGTGYVVRVKSIENSSCYDDSNGSFTISGLILTSPDGGENWALGTSKSITWASGGIAGNVKLILFKNGTRIGNIAYDIPADQGSYSWTVGSLLDGSTVSPGAGYVVRVKSIENSSLSDDSNGGFGISDF